MSQGAGGKEVYGSWACFGVPKGLLQDVQALKVLTKAGKVFVFRVEE